MITHSIIFVLLFKLCAHKFDMLASLAVCCAPNYRLCWPDGRGRSIDGLPLACIVREATAALGQRRAVAKRLEFKPREATR